MPELYIITGSNGAGKSSIGPDYLPAHIRQQGPIFDGDKLFIEKRKELWRTIKSHKECSKLGQIGISAASFISHYIEYRINKKQNIFFDYDILIMHIL